MSQITKKQLQYALSQVLVALKDLNARLEKLEANANQGTQTSEQPPVVAGDPPG